MSEWFKELVLKTSVPATVPWVRIPPLPPSDIITTMGSTASAKEFTPFDEQRHVGGLRRADIVFGPDPFDPRIVDGYTPLSDALRVMVKGGELEDLGIPKDALDKTVGEVYGDMGSHEIRELSLEISRRLEPKPPTNSPRKNFLKRVLTFAS